MTPPTASRTSAPIFHVGFVSSRRLVHRRDAEAEVDLVEAVARRAAEHQVAGRRRARIARVEAVGGQDAVVRASTTARAVDAGSTSGSSRACVITIGSATSKNRSRKTPTCRLGVIVWLNCLNSRSLRTGDGAGRVGTGHGRRARASISDVVEPRSVVDLAEDIDGLCVRRDRTPVRDARCRFAPAYRRQLARTNEAAPARHGRTQ